MTTVGYGDLYPVTHIGRGICTFAWIVGTLALTCLSTILSMKCTMDEAQTAAANEYIRRLETNRTLKDDARFIITNYLAMVTRVTLERRKRVEEMDRIVKERNGNGLKVTSEMKEKIREIIKEKVKGIFSKSEHPNLHRDAKDSFCINILSYMPMFVSKRKEIAKLGYEDANSKETKPKEKEEKDEDEDEEDIEDEISIPEEEEVKD
mmetsp:Transcript_14857/g.16568  ORF Transcript_14857/g.16568 Transcript_14857/m.16568 type:complete len:207 (+) Transcript_14857:413-1033(+)